MAASAPSAAMTSTASAATATATSRRLPLGFARAVQDVVGPRLPARGFPDPDPDPDVSRIVQMGVDRLEAVVPRRPAPHLDLDPATGKIELVVDDDQPGQIGHPVAADQGGHGHTRLVHEGLGHGHGHQAGGQPQLGHL